MRLYELNFEMNEIAERLEAALEWEPDTDTLGRPIDFDGNVIDDVEKFREDMIEAWKTTLDGVAEEFDEKAANIAVYIKDLKSESEQLYKEEKALKKRRAVKENALKTVTKYLLENMQEAGKSKIGTAKAEISLRTNPESVEIADENGFVKWAQENGDDLLRYPKPEINKSAVKAAIKGGKNIPGAEIVRTQSLIIK